MGINYIIAREQKKWWTWHVISVIAENEMFNESLQHIPYQLATLCAPLIEVLLIKILLFLDHLFQSNQHFQAIEFVDQPIPEKL